MMGPIWPVLAARETFLLAQAHEKARLRAINAIVGVPGYLIPAQPVKCAYCGTPRQDRTHNCRNCAGLEVA